MQYTIKTFKDKYSSTVKKFLLEILEDEFGHYNVDRPDLDAISDFYQADSGNFWIALSNGELIGTIGLKDYKGIAYVKRMAVRKDYRGQGVAQRLLSTLMEYAKKNSFTEIYLSTSSNLVAANKFYKKEGFKIIKKLPDEIPAQIAQINFMKKI